MKSGRDTHRWRGRGRSQRRELRLAGSSLLTHYDRIEAGADRRTAYRAYRMSTYLTTDSRATTATLTSLLLKCLHSLSLRSSNRNLILSNFLQEATDFFQFSAGDQLS